MLLRCLMFILASITCGTLLSQDTSKTEPTSTEPSLNTDELYTLQQHYRQKKEELFAPFDKKLEAMLNARIAAAQKNRAEMRKRGNIKGMAVAKKAISIYSKALEELKEKHEFTFPKKIRKELREEVAACAKEKDAILEKAKQRAKELKTQYRKKFAEIYKTLCEDNAPSEKEINKRFLEFLTSNIELPKPPPEQQTNAATPDELAELGVTQDQEAKRKQLNPIIASKGSGSHWVPVGKWTGNMMGMDVVELALGDKSDTFEWTQFSALANEDSTLKYEVIKPLPHNPAFAYRLKRISGYGGVAVMEWPSPHNSWKLIFRTDKPQPSESDFPLKRGFVLQVSLPENELKKAFGANCYDSENGGAGAAAPKKNVKKVPIEIYSHPAGAKVYVDGKPLIMKKKNVATPCKVLVPEGGCAIKLTMLGYIPKIFPKYMAKQGAVIKASLEKDPSFEVYKRNIAANAPEWTDTRIALAPGDKVIIQVKGRWCCVRSTKGKCGPRGIPNDTAHYQYYADASKDLRKTQSYPYGALLMRIGKDEHATIRYISKQTIKLSVRKGGPLFFDINEREGKPRKNNKGQLGLTIMVKRKK